jgi:polyhydroxyalkanoate synthesis repressor PhaR
MPVIKRYPNRKLYDTEAKQYITLGQIAEMIRQGSEVQVVDHTTGEDLTTLTLTQIIFEQEKQRSGFLPETLLTGLIQAGGERLSTLRRALASPLELAHHVDDEIQRRIEVLVSRGEIAAEDGRNLRDKLLSLSQRPADTATIREEDLEAALAERGVPTREEFQLILAQLDALTAKLDGIEPR